MTDKQGADNKTNPATFDYMLSQYGHNATTIQYIFQNIFRILRPLRKKYQVTVNELIVLNGMYLYCRHEGTSFSQSAIQKYISYYSMPKVKWYIKSLAGKECIVLSDYWKGFERYKLTSNGIEIIEALDSCYIETMQKYYKDYKIIG